MGVGRFETTFELTIQIIYYCIHGLNMSAQQCVNCDVWWRNYKYLTPIK